MLAKYNDSRYSGYASNALRNPTAAKQEDLIGLFMHISQSKKLKFTGVEDFATESGIPAQLTSREDVHLMNAALAHVSYSLGRTKDAITYINNAIGAKIYSNVEYLICVKRYLSMLQQGYAADDIAATLELFHKPETVAQLYSYIQNGGNPLDPVVLRCDLQCDASCMLHDCCKKQYSDQLAELIINKSSTLDQSVLTDLIKSI